jgi:Plant transposon protein
MDDNGLPIPKRRRSVTNFNWERARAAIFEDYMSPMPKFNDRFFERHFRVSRSIVEELRLICAAADPFFQDRMHAAKRTLGICPDAKILFPLQMLANGTSPSAHQSYYQMGETTAREALKKLCRIIRQSDDLRERFLRSMSRSDAQHASELHLDTHGIEGMVGSLDCMHVGWKNCPVAWQGAYTSGKEGHPTLVLEAMADHNLFVWHASFGWAGTLNDINIWEGSALHKGFLDGTWSERVDFPFTINGQDFTKLFVLVDGIYPELARFAKPLAEPVGAHQHAYSSWQESSRKDIERTFGVIQRKFHITVKHMEQWYREDIEDIVIACVMLHNWMVRYRLSKDESEHIDWYEPAPEDPVNAAIHVDPDRDSLDRRRAEVQENAQLIRMFYPGMGEDFVAQRQEEEDRLLPYRYQVVQERWAKLHDTTAHKRLRDAIAAQVVSNSNARANAVEV